ncbi:MAG: hypothetical protein LQ349_005211 [Xanthoria aureola]|nr:MAG: hypothetical protein LQ349_005211 [Xanthoria aureola]
MSFGVGLGDLIAAATLAWNVYRSCKGMRKEFAEVGREARAAHTVVKELVEEANNDQSVLNRRGAARSQELLSLVSGLQKALEDFDRIIIKYRGLSRRERRIWDQLGLASEDLSGIRDKLTYHLAAINAFTDSLERGTLARMETVMLELVEEVRQGRRPPTLVSIDHLQDTSGWKELESELAEDGITAADVVEHKAAIRVFLLGRFKDSNADHLSFHDVASAVETGSGSDLIAGTMSTSSEILDRPSIYVEREDIIGSPQSFRTAPEQLEPEAAPALLEKPLQVPFAPFTRIPQQAPSDAVIPAGAARQFGQFTFGKSSMKNYRYRHSVDYGRDRSLLAPQTEMILIIDPIHSSFSKIMHAYLRSLTVNQPLVRERIDTVRSTGWKMQESGGVDMIQIDDMIKDLLLTNGVEVPTTDSYNRIREFHLGDILQFDHIIYLESPTFLHYLEANVQRIARIKADEDLEERQPARLSKYDLPSSIQLPEVMSEKRGLGTQIFRSRQKLALEEIFEAVQRFTSDFLEREFGIRKSSQGFKKAAPRRPSSVSVTSSVGLREPLLYD